MRNQIKHISTNLARDIRLELSYYRIKGVHCLAFLTYRCTSKCKTCNIWKRNTSQHEEMDWEQWKDILIRLKNYGVKSLEIFGGDALLRKDIIFRIIRFCADNGIESFFPTNSLLLDSDTAKALVEAELGTIYFSLDNINADNDFIRGVEQSFGKVKVAMENLVKARAGSAFPKIVICSTISNLNYDRFESIVDFLKDYPVDAIYPRAVGEISKHNIESSEICGIHPDPYFVSSEDKSHLLTENQIKRFRETIIELKKNKDKKQPYINFQSVDVIPDSAFTTGDYGFKRCRLCTSLVSIAPNGNIFPCPFYNDYVIGNLYREENLDKIWGNKKHKKFVKFQQEKKIPICKNCNMPPFYPEFTENIGYHLRRLIEKGGFYY